jgi:hypothetical protein
MPSLNQFKKLDPELRKDLIERVILRKKRFLALTGKRGTFDPSTCDVLLVGDRPAPSAPDDANFHYTPFGALWNSSLYVNMELHKGGIDEARLAWVNSADFHGVPQDYSVLDLPWKHVIALGGAGSKWLKKSPQKIPHEIFHHPSSWKRFHSKEPYPLIDYLKTI